MTIRGADKTGVVLTGEQVLLLESIFWLALGAVLGWQERVCYEGAHPKALGEPVSLHVGSGPSTVGA